MFCSNHISTDISLGLRCFSMNITWLCEWWQIFLTFDSSLFHWYPNIWIKGTWGSPFVLPYFPGHEVKCHSWNTQALVSLSLLVSLSFVIFILSWHNSEALCWDWKAIHVPSSSFLFRFKHGYNQQNSSVGDSWFGHLCSMVWLLCSLQTHNHPRI